MYVTPEQIYSATNGGLDVILHYYPQAAESVNNRSKKFRIRQTDKTASASLKQIEGGIWIVTDFGGDQVSRNCIEITRKQENCDFKEAISFIANRFNIVPPEAQREVFKAEFTKRDATDEEKDGSYETPTKEFTEPELRELFAEKVIEYYQSQYGNDWQKKLIDICARCNFYSLSSYTYIKDRKAITTASTEHYPIFLIEGDGFKKIYQPKNIDKKYRFRYFGTRPKDYINGYKRLIKLFNDANASSKNDEPFEDDEPKVQTLDNVILCSGDRDSLNVAALGYNVIWLNSETAKISWDKLTHISGMVDNFYNLPDIDTTGKRQGHELAMFFLDIKTIWLPEELRTHKDWRGNPCKDLRDYLRFYTKKQFDDLVKTALPYKFWVNEPKFDRKGNFTKYGYAFHNTRAYNFLMRNGFYRFRIDNEKEGYIYVHIDQNNVKQVKPNDVKNYINSFLENRRMDEELRNTFYRSNQLGETSLSNLKEVSIDFTDFDKETQFMFFINRTWKITKAGIEEFLPSDISKFVWDTELIKHRVERLDPPFTVSTTVGADGTKQFDITINTKNCLFLNYLINTSRIYWRKELESNWTPVEESERLKYIEENKFNIAGSRLTDEERQEQKMHLINKLYSIGYLLHRYKDPSRAWCVFAMDGKLSEDGESHGGSGKSVAYKSLRFFLSSLTLDARNPKLMDNPHVYELVTEHTDYVFFDDANQYFKFDLLFSVITGDFPVNPKNNKQFSIPFAKAPKLTITSNYTPRQIDPSTVRRILYTVFSDYYHYNKDGEYRETRSVKDDFGKNLFDDFNENEWNQFFNTAAYCCSMYLNYEKIDPPMDNVTMRNLQTEMGPVFQSWADVYFLDKLDELVPKIEAAEDFKMASNQKNWTSQRFMKALKAWCRFNRYDLDPIDLQNSQGRIMRKMPQKNKDGTINVMAKKVSTEMIYIRTKQEINKNALEGKENEVPPVVDANNKDIHNGSQEEETLPF